MQFDIITIFPNIFDSYFNESILKRAQDRKLIKIKIHNLRDFTDDKHKQIDDRPFGGGPGMVLMAEPIIKCLDKILIKSKTEKIKIILFSPAGKQLNHKIVKQYSKLDRIILICGRYEGIDARVEKFINEKISIGNYVLSGGEIPAMVTIEAVSRLLPEVLGNSESANDDSFVKENYLEYPQYTRPEELKIKNKNLKVPKILLSGDHGKIQEWREKHSKF